MNGADGPALRYREVTSGGSFGASSLTQHVGLGRATSVESLEIFWPASRTRQVFGEVPVNSFIEVRELEKTFAVRTLPRLVLGREALRSNAQRPAVISAQPSILSELGRWRRASSP